MSSLVFPGPDVAAAGPTPPVGPTAVGLTDPRRFSFAGPGDEDSSESSSIGSPSSDDDDDGDEDRGLDGQDEAESKSAKDDSTGSGSGSGSSSLGSLSSLEDSFPIKKGLSNHFAGKSRSFSNLSECAGAYVGDLVKPENPFNKRRRIQIVNRMSYKRRASCSSLITTVLPPLLSPEHALQEEDENDDDSDDNNGDDGDNRGRCFPSSTLAPHGESFYHEAKIKKATLNSPRSFSLFEDLRHVQIPNQKC